MVKFDSVEGRLQKDIMCGVCGAKAWDGKLRSNKAFHSIDVEYRPNHLTHMWNVSCWAVLVD